MADDVGTVRAFNRFYTRILGLLDEGLLETPYTLTEARVLFELAQRDAAEVLELRRVLRLDAGYVSRIMRRFEADGLVERARSESDGRRQQVTLTATGRSAFEDLDARSARQVADWLARLGDDDRRRLVEAMGTIGRILGGHEAAESSPTVTLRPPGAGDFGWVVQRHGVLYAGEYGWDATFEALVARVVSDFVGGEAAGTPGQAAWIAEAGGDPVGCVFCVRADEATAQLRLLLVEPSARGLGVGSALVDECLRFAREAGYRRITLWTNDVLHAARRIYQRAGFELVDEEKHHSFGHDLVGQNWARDL